MPALHKVGTRLPRPAARQLEQTARAEYLTVAQWLRRLIERELRRRGRGALRRRVGRH